MTMKTKNKKKKLSHFGKTLRMAKHEGFKMSIKPTDECKELENLDGLMMYVNFKIPDYLHDYYVIKSIEDSLTRPQQREYASQITNLSRTDFQKVTMPLPKKFDCLLITLGLIGDYVVHSPKKMVYHVNNLSEFCKEHNLNLDKLYGTYNANSSFHYKGWYIESCKL